MLCFMRFWMFLFVVCFVPFHAFAFWGEHGAGITDVVYTSSAMKEVYLTLDACGSKNDGYDADLIAFFRKEKIQATLFINARWIDKNPEIFSDLAKDTLFKIANHGMSHKPASVSGKTVYRIKGTVSKDDLVREVKDNADKIEKLTGKRPVWYRSGTAYYDDRAIKIITQDMGFKIAGFAITVDEGATLPADKVYRKTLQAKSGDILLAHMNHPEKETYEGLKPALLELRKQGFVFKQLPD